MRVATETRHLNRLGELGELKQERNTDSEKESNTASHGAQSKGATLCAVAGSRAHC